MISTRRLFRSGGRAIALDLDGSPPVPGSELACLAVLARHVGQGLRNHNPALAHDRPRLHLERRKLIFLDVVALEEALASGVDRPAHEAVLFVLGTTPTVLDLLATRQASGLAPFVTSSQPDTSLALWRYVNLDD